MLIGESYSKNGHMNSEVPQGSSLELILFVIYTTNLQYLLENLDVKYSFYADNIHIYLTAGDPIETQHKLLQVHVAMSSWITTRKLKVNPGKTEIIIAGSCFQKKCVHRRISFHA